VSKFASIAFSYYFHGGGGPINAGTKGTLYISSTIPEVQVLKAFRNRIKTVTRLYERMMTPKLVSKSTIITVQSSTSLSLLPVECIDYVFVAWWVRGSTRGDFNRLPRQRKERKVLYRFDGGNHSLSGRALSTHLPIQRSSDPLPLLTQTASML